MDNPDQRIQEDVNSFTNYSLSFFLTIGKLILYASVLIYEEILSSNTCILLCLRFSH